MLHRPGIQSGTKFFARIVLWHLEFDRDSHLPSFLWFLRIFSWCVRSRHPIIRSLPFPLHLHTALWRRSAKPMVYSRERRFFDFLQQTHFYRSLLVSRGVSRVIGVTSSQPVNRTLT